LLAQPYCAVTIPNANKEAAVTATIDSLVVI